MKQKINIRLTLIAILAALATIICTTYVYYGIFQEQVRHDLEIEARLLSEAGITELVNNPAIIGDEDIRITWISEDGEVLFDNDADGLGNHMDRPEVHEALETGVGESVRKSDTMELRTFYYAILLEDGTVLRVAAEARSIINVFLSAFPVVVLIICVIIAICIIVGHYLTKQLLRPIGEMAEDMDNYIKHSTYKELEPFVERIREQHEDILAAAKSRQEFTANVSHELKTPIAAISGYAELIENKMVDETQQVKFAGDIKKNADRLVSLVNDILRLSELDQGNITAEFTKVDLYEIARERIEFLQATAISRSIALTVQGEPCSLVSSKGLLVELIDNLVQNGIRYNVPNGKVEVEVFHEAGKAVLIVRDTGLGIPDAEQGRIFERFYRVDKSRSRETGGTGLGLAIVKHIVELHDGNIQLDSKVGIGTTIKVTL